MIRSSESRSLSSDCCSYSCCYNGCLDLEDGPRGIPPKPDILIATNNQCNTLPCWWNTLAHRYQVPLIVIDYPGEACDRQSAYEYVRVQHADLIEKLEKLSGNTLDNNRLSELIENSRKSVSAWNEVISFLKIKEIKITQLFDDINFLITARCRPETSQMYEMMAAAMMEKDDIDHHRIPVFWLGYPLWYHNERYLAEYLSDCNIVGSNYITWWSLDYSGADVSEQLFNAYNYTFLNLSQNSRDLRLKSLIRESGAKCAVVLHNKSCKCDFVSARNIELPQAELDIDMIDRNYLDSDKAGRLLELLRETVCTG